MLNQGIHAFILGSTVLLADAKAALAFELQPSPESEALPAPGDELEQRWHKTGTTFYPYGGYCLPLKGPCHEGDFEWSKVQKEFKVNLARDIDARYRGQIPAWGPHTFLCKAYRPPLNVPYHKLHTLGDDRYKYYAAVSDAVQQSLKVGCGDVLRVQLRGQTFRYLVTDVCPRVHSVQGRQPRCEGYNIDLSYYGALQQIAKGDVARMTNTRGEASFMVECRQRSGRCGRLKLGPMR